MILASNTFGRLLVRCCFAAVMLFVSTATSAMPSMTLPAPGQARVWLADDYAANAQFELKRGRVVVWESVGGAAPGPLVEFAGVLDDEAARVLGELLRKGRIHTLSVAGPGGLVVPTLKLGRALRAKGVTTVVEAGRGCYSACALLFLAGDVRIVNERPTAFGRTAAEVGFHAPYTIGTDGEARHQQEAKTSSSCAYIKQMVPAQAAAELCDYTLATKGMATFSLDAGKRLHIYTDSESDVLARLAESLLGTPTPDEQHWVSCERDRLYGQTSAARLNPDTSYKQLGPCADWRAPPAPAPQSRLADLTKAARVLGPSRPTKEMYQSAKRELIVRLSLAGLRLR